MSLQIHFGLGHYIYRCDRCAVEAFLHSDNVAEWRRSSGWQERTPDVGTNFHICADCVLEECEAAFEAARSA